MRYPSPGRLRSVEEFRGRWAQAAPELGCDAELRGREGPLGRPLELFGRTLTNRFAVHPMEGWDGTREGAPSELTLRRWHRFGMSGADLVWGGEAFAVQQDGRANPNQLCLRAESEGDLARLLEELRAGRRDMELDPDGLVVGLQLTHSGRWSRPDGPPAPRVAFRHPVLDARVGIDSDAAVLSDGELEAIGERYVAAARVAQRAGFDFVDLKCCHGYLMHELLAARARPGSYGGSLEGRTRLFRRIAEEVRRECPGLGLGLRLSVGDVFPHTRSASTDTGEPAGWDAELPYEHGFGVDPQDPRRMDLTEPLAFLELARELGVGAVNVTLGSPYTCPHLQRPAAFPPSDGYQPPRDPLAEVAEHLRVTRRVKAALPELRVVGTGYSYLQDFLPHVAQHELGAGHVDLVGLGRMVLSYPELPFDVLGGKPVNRRRVCRTFSDCTTGPRNGLPSGCYPLDEHYRTLPEAAQLARLKAALREREASHEH